MHSTTFLVKWVRVLLMSAVPFILVRQVTFLMNLSKTSRPQVLLYKENTFGLECGLGFLVLRFRWEEFLVKCGQSDGCPPFQTYVSAYFCLGGWESKNWSRFSSSLEWRKIFPKTMIHIDDDRVVKWTNLYHPSFFLVHFPRTFNFRAESGRVVRLSHESIFKKTYKYTSCFKIFFQWI